LTNQTVTIGVNEINCNEAVVLSQDTLNYLFDGVMNANIPQSAPQVAKDSHKKALIELGAMIHATPKPTLVDMPVVAGVYAWSYPKEKKVAVIKIIRELTGWGLKETKDLVEGGGQENFLIGSTESFAYNFLLVMTAEQVHQAQELLAKAVDSYYWNTEGITFKPNFFTMAEKHEPCIERIVYLSVRADSKTVLLAAKPPVTAPGDVVIETKLRVPMAMFSQQTIRARVELPPNGQPMTDEVIADLSQAVGMAYGSKVELVIEKIGTNDG
jgi:hypothetical protein